MKRKIVNLTPEQAKKAGAEYEQLFGQAIAQLGEHQMWLQLQINAIPEKFWRSTTEHRTILESVMELTLGSIRIEPSPFPKQPPMVAIVYEWPDMLYEFLRRDDLPSDALRKVLAGGIPLDDADTTTITRLP